MKKLKIIGLNFKLMLACMVLSSSFLLSGVLDSSVVLADDFKKNQFGLLDEQWSEEPDEMRQNRLDVARHRRWVDENIVAKFKKALEDLKKVDWADKVEGILRDLDFVNSFFDTCAHSLVVDSREETAVNVGSYVICADRLVRLVLFSEESILKCIENAAILNRLIKFVGFKESFLPLGVRVDSSFSNIRSSIGECKVIFEKCLSLIYIKNSSEDAWKKLKMYDYAGALEKLKVVNKFFEMNPLFKSDSKNGEEILVETDQTKKARQLYVECSAGLIGLIRLKKDGLASWSLDKMPREVLNELKKFILFSKAFSEFYNLNDDEWDLYSAFVNDCPDILNVYSSEYEQ